MPFCIATHSLQAPHLNICRDAIAIAVGASLTASIYAGLSGFLKNPEDDRRAAISAMVEKSGGKFIDLQFLRGKYDIAVVAEVSSFEDAAAVKVLVVASGALDRLEMMEYIDMNDIATRANKKTGAYRAPGALMMD